MHPSNQLKKHTQVPGKKFVAARGLNINFILIEYKTHIYTDIHDEHSSQTG